MVPFNFRFINQLVPNKKIKQNEVPLHNTNKTDILPYKWNFESRFSGRNESRIALVKALAICIIFAKL